MEKRTKENRTWEWFDENHQFMGKYSWFNHYKSLRDDMIAMMDKIVELEQKLINLNHKVNMRTKNENTISDSN